MNILSEKLIKRFEPVEPMIFYREIFPVGELDEWGANTKGKYAAIAVEMKKIICVSANPHSCVTICKQNFEKAHR